MDNTKHALMFEVSPFFKATNKQNKTITTKNDKQQTNKKQSNKKGLVRKFVMSGFLLVCFLPV